MPDTSPTLSRRQALGLLGGAGAAAAIPLLGVTPADAAPAVRPQSGGSGAPPVQGLHLTFGADPTSQMVASWITEGAVNAPRVLYGTMDGGFGKSADARTMTYVDGTSGRTVYVHHASMSRLRPDTDYVYVVQHDGAHPGRRRIPHRATRARAVHVHQLR
jgi:hypothetical protein